MVGPELGIDTERFFVICVNSLGSCFGSTGAASIDPATGKPYRLTFPDLSVEDIARAGYETMRSLGIKRLDAVVGPSLGGMVVLAFVAQFPGAARRLVSVSGTAAHGVRGRRPRLYDHGRSRQGADSAIARSRCVRFNAKPLRAIPTGSTGITRRTSRPAAGSASRASWEPSPTGRRRNGSCVSIASRFALT